MREIEEYTLEDIKLLQNRKLYDAYNQEIANLQTNRIASNVVNKMYGEPLNKIIRIVEEEEDYNRSMSLFPGDLVLLHLGLKEMHTRTFITCDFSGSLIRPKDLYINYRPLVENLTTNNTYVLKKTIKVEPGYISELPKDIHELEQLEMYMNLEKENKNIDYSHLNRQMGGELKLQKLKRRK